MIRATGLSNSRLHTKETLKIKKTLTVKIINVTSSYSSRVLCLVLYTNITTLPLAQCRRHAASENNLVYLHNAGKRAHWRVKRVSFHCTVHQLPVDVLPAY